MLADSHCHLDWFKNPAEKIESAKKAGVERMLTNSTNLENIESSIALSKEFPEVDCAIGVHPVDVLHLEESKIKASFELIEANLSNAAAIGEIGMDFKHASKEKRGLQEDVFRRFVSMALEHKKPLVVHSRYSDTQCLDILEEMAAKKVLMHWFTNSKKTSERAVSLGYNISCGPIIFTDQSSSEVVESIPVGNLLLETDAPVSFNGNKSEPSWIPRVCEKLAQIKGISKEEAESATGKNFVSLFGSKL